jgi:hypothetical protein
MTATNLGAGAGATLSGIELNGTCSNVSIGHNNLSGNFDTKNFYNDDNVTGTVTGANISGNTFVNNGGTGAALKCANTRGVIASNTFVGFTSPSVSEKVTTSGSAINPGSIASGATFIASFTVTGAIVGDTVIVTPAGGTYPLVPGLELKGIVSSPGAVQVLVRNGTAGPLTPAAFDVSYTVLRGV